MSRGAGEFIKLTGKGRMKDWDPEYQPVLQNFHPGQVIRSYARTVTESDLVAFIGFTGMRMPIFIDREYAEKQGPYGERICPGFLTASVAAGMLESILGRNVIAGLGMDTLRFVTPVKIGDTLHAIIEIREARLTREPGRGMIRAFINTINQRGETALEFLASVLIKADPA